LKDGAGYIWLAPSILQVICLYYGVVVLSKVELNDFVHFLIVLLGS